MRRDLEPRNFAREDGGRATPKLLDFGRLRPLTAEQLTECSAFAAYEFSARCTRLGVDMSFARLLVWLGVIAPAEVTSISQLAPGAVRAVGTLVCEEPIRSPIQGRQCVAFYYRASAAGSGRASAGARMRGLRRATVFAPRVGLSLEGGVVRVAPPPSDDFDAQSHERLAAQDLFGFRAVESTLRAGQRVRITGKLVYDGERVATLHATALEPLEPPSKEPSQEEPG